CTRRTKEARACACGAASPPNWPASRGPANEEAEATDDQTRPRRLGQDRRPPHHMRRLPESEVHHPRPRHAPGRRRPSRLAVPEAGQGLAPGLRDDPPAPASPTEAARPGPTGAIRVITWLYWSLVALWRRNTGRSWRDCVEADWRAAGWVPPPCI